MINLPLSPSGLPMPVIPTMPEMQPPDIEAIKAHVSHTVEWLQHPLGRRLLDLEITPNKILPKRSFLFRLFGMPCFPRGELVAVTGKAKSGKTFLCSALMVVAGHGQCLGIIRQEEQSLPVLWIDTEQSEESTQDILVKRIIRMASSRSPEHKDGYAEEPSLPQRSSSNQPFESSGISVINLRSVGWDQRMELIEAAMELTKPALVIFDGIRDVVSDINDGVVAQQVIERTMRLASTYNACIVCVLHQNKAVEDHSLRGALGTELQNKSFETYECKKGEDRSFTVEQTSTRKHDITDRLRFMVSPDGLPVAMTALPSEQQNADMSENGISTDDEAPYPPFNAAYLDGEGHLNAVKIFREVLADGAMRATPLRERVMQLVGIVRPETYNALLRRALDQGLLLRDQKGERCVFYSLRADSSAAGTEAVQHPEKPPLEAGFEPSARPPF